MEQASWKRVKQVFHEALEKTGPERNSFVAAACGQDRDLRAQVEALLAAHDEAEGFLASPTMEDANEAAKAARGLATAAPPEGPGSTIGPYKLLQAIGEGGFGIVYMAEQEQPVRRRVALKIIKLGMDTKQVIARFEAERQALAMMDHPNIAKVFDAGATETGRPYFVMELVKGVPITEYCDANRLSTRERLQLFVEVCQAVQHAHQKGIIHRDLKPSNVLVTLHDGRPVPKVIDFGVAKATAHRLTEKTLFTEYGQLIGTPAYMSPEQAEMSGLDIDTRSDIYSLGVLLYELLTGTTPFEAKPLRSAGYLEVLRILREDEPPTPSSRLRTLGDALTEVAKQRNAEPGALTKLVRGDLDWIVMKALEKDRTRRYASASEFAADIGRHFHDEPIAARPPSTAYRLRKFVKKHKGPVAAAAGVALAIVLGASIATWQAVRARAEAHRAQANAILASATGTEDPLLKALLIDEIADVPDLPGKLAVLRDAANYPLPISVLHVADYANNVEYSPDGRYLAGTFMDGTARIWRTDGTGEPLVLQHDDEVDALEFSPDGTRIVTGTSAGTVWIWPLDGVGDPIIFTADKRIESAQFSPDGTRVSAGTEQGGPIWIWPADGSGDPVVIGVEDVLLLGGGFFPDGDRILTGGDSGARIWRADGAGPTVFLPGPHWWVYALMSPDGKLVASSGTGSVYVYSADGTGEPLVLQHERAISWASSFNGELVTTSSRDSTVRIWHLDRPDQPITLRHPAMTFAEISHDGSRVFTRSADGKIRVWRADGSGPVAVFAGPRGGGPVSESPDGSRITVEFTDRSLRTWLLNETDGEALVLRHDERVNGVAYSPDGRRIATASNDGVVRVWSSEGSGEPLLLRGHRDRVWSVAFSPDGRRLVTASRDSTVRIWAADGAGEPIVLAHPSVMYDAAFSPDGDRVVTGGLDGRVRAWPANGAEAPVVLAEHGDWVSWSPDVDVAVLSVAFSADGKRVLSASNDQTARITTVDGTRQPVILRGNYEVDAAAFSPDGEWVALGSDDARVRRADGSGTPILLRGHEFYVNTVAFSPDGSRVLAGGDDGTVWIWRLDETEEPIVLRGHTGPVLAAAFSPDGNRVVTASWDGTARIWRVTFPELLEYVHANLRACLTPKQRVQYLDEPPSEAAAAADACERRLRRGVETEPS